MKLLHLFLLSFVLMTAYVWLFVPEPPELVLRRQREEFFSSLAAVARSHSGALAIKR